MIPKFSTKNQSRIQYKAVELKRTLSVGDKRTFQKKGEGDRVQFISSFILIIFRVEYHNSLDKWARLRI